MSSRRNDSAGVAIVELTALLPWWGGVMLAGASYGALHLYVSRPMSPVSPGDSTFLIQAMARALAITGQYLLPVLFLIAALTSVFRRRKRRQLLAGVSAAPDALNAMSWRRGIQPPRAFPPSLQRAPHAASRWRCVPPAAGPRLASDSGDAPGTQPAWARVLSPDPRRPQESGCRQFDLDLTDPNDHSPRRPGQTTWLVVNLPAGDRNTDAFASPVRSSSIRSISTVNTRPGLADSGRLQGSCSAQAVRCGRLPFAAVFACLVSGSPPKGRHPVQLTESLRSLDLERIVLIPIFSFLMLFSSLSLFAQGGASLGGLVGVLVLFYRLMLVAFYVLVVVLLLTRSDAKAKSRRVLPRVAAYAGTFAPFLLGFAESSQVVPGLALAAVSIQAIGMAFVVYSLAILRRSFGVAPQVRALVRSGPYRFIRHPLYVGEIVTLTGAVLMGPSWQKVVILMVTAAVQVYRAIQEERLLSAHDPEYAAYMTATKRFVPGLF